VIRAIERDDRDAWLRMRCALWPEGEAGEHAAEIDAYFAGEFPRGPWQVFVAEPEGGELVGFAEVSIRSYAEGCSSARVAYLEGWWVANEMRRRGVGAALVQAAEAWGRAQGCSEFASDADPSNQVSVEAHRALGFEDAGLVQCFRKSLAD
jgi:aminoglycoside 6'-N-acetyltransferase I